MNNTNNANYESGDFSNDMLPDHNRTQSPPPAQQLPPPVQGAPPPNERPAMPTTPSRPFGGINMFGGAALDMASARRSATMGPVSRNALGANSNANASVAALGQPAPLPGLGGTPGVVLPPAPAGPPSGAGPGPARALPTGAPAGGAAPRGPLPAPVGGPGGATPSRRGPAAAVVPTLGAVGNNNRCVRMGERVARTRRLIDSFS